MPATTDLAVVKPPEACTIITQERMEELRDLAEERVASKDAPHLLISCPGVAHFVELTEAKPITFGGEDDDDTKVGYSLLFVVRPELLGAVGIEQLYTMVASVNALNDRYFKGKADRVFLKEGTGDPDSLKPFGSLYINMKKTFKKDDPLRKPKPPKVYAKDAKTIIPATEITDGSLIRAQFWAGPPMVKAHGKVLWGGSFYCIQLLQKNEGQIATSVDVPLGEDAPPEDDGDSIERYNALSAGNAALPAPAEGGGTDSDDLDDDIPF